MFFLSVLHMVLPLMNHRTETAAAAVAWAVQDYPKSSYKLAKISSDRCSQLEQSITRWSLH